MLLKDRHRVKQVANYCTSKLLPFLAKIGSLFYLLKWGGTETIENMMQKNSIYTVALKIKV